MTSTACDNLSPVQAQVALSLASGASISAAANAAVLSRTTIYSWMKTEPAFATAVEHARQEFVLTLQDQLRDASAKALNTVIAIMDDPNAPASVRLKAALAVLNRPHLPEPGWHLPERITSPQWNGLLDSLAEIKGCHRQLQYQAGIERLSNQQPDTELNTSEQNLRNPLAGLPAEIHSSATIPNTSEQKSTVIPPQTSIRVPKAGRNEPCPCGSGKRFKRCCLNASPGSLKSTSTVLS